MDSEQSSMGIAEHLANFLSAAVGLTLQATLRDIDAVPAWQRSHARALHSDPSV